MNLLPILALYKYRYFNDIALFAASNVNDPFPDVKVDACELLVLLSKHVIEVRFPSIITSYGNLSSFHLPSSAVLLPIVYLIQNLSNAF